VSELLFSEDHSYFSPLKKTAIRIWHEGEAATMEFHPELRGSVTYWCTISLNAAVLPGLKSGRALVKKKNFTHYCASHVVCFTRHRCQCGV
jgi:hypothetical protein